MIFMLNITHSNNPCLIVNFGTDDARALQFGPLYRVLFYDGSVFRRYLVEEIEPLYDAKYIVKDSDCELIVDWHGMLNWLELAVASFLP